MATSSEVVKNFYAAVVKRDFAAARKFLADDLVFVGLFETYKNPDEYLKALTGLMGVTVRLVPKSIFGENEQAAIFFDLETKAPVEAVTFVAEWHQVRNGKIYHVQSAFDGRPFEAMFAGSKRA
jgi:hypothetical protein